MQNCFRGPWDYMWLDQTILTETMRLYFKIKQIFCLYGKSDKVIPMFCLHEKNGKVIPMFCLHEEKYCYHSKLSVESTIIFLIRYEHFLHQSTILE